MQHGPHSVGRSSWMPPHGSNPTDPHPPPLQILYGCPCRHARSDSSLRIFSSGCSFQRSPYRLLFIDVSPGAPSPRSCSVHLAGLSSLIAPQGPHHPGPLLADLSSRALVYEALLADPLPRIPSADSSGWAPPGRSSPRIPSAHFLLWPQILKAFCQFPWRLPPLHLRTHRVGPWEWGGQAIDCKLQLLLTCITKVQFPSRICDFVEGATGFCTDCLSEAPRRLLPNGAQGSQTRSDAFVRASACTLASSTW